MGRLQRLIAVLLAFSKTEPEKPADNECSWISGTVELGAVSFQVLERISEVASTTAPAVLYVAGCYGVFSLEELLALLGIPTRESLLPALSKPASPPMLPLIPYLQMSAAQPLFLQYNRSCVTYFTLQI